MRQRLDRDPDPMTLRRCAVEHPFGTIEAWMGAAHFQMRRLRNVRTEMALHVLACNIKRMISLAGLRRLLGRDPELKPTTTFPKPKRAAQTLSPPFTRLAREFLHRLGPSVCAGCYSQDV